jgi:aspartate/methionine/tyrosine aminotransferase
MHVAKRVREAASSATLAFTHRVVELQRSGRDVISFVAGEPDFETPKHVKEAAIRAIQEGKTTYTQNTGIHELREAVAARVNRNWGSAYHPDDVLIASGAKHAIANAVFALCDSGDEVIIFSPYWVSYPEMVRLAGATPVIVPTRFDRKFDLDLAALERALSSRTKAVLFNNPVNPTGRVYTVEALDALVERLRSHDLFVISDEVYERIVYGVRFHSLAAFPDLRDRLVVVSGVSKTYAMTGWRIGYALGPREVISQMAKLQGHMTSNACTVSQWAALAALTGPQDAVEKMVGEFRRRRDFCLERLREIPGLKYYLPEGAFYFFVDVSAYLGKRTGAGDIQTPFDLCMYLLEEQGLALVPGEGFGSHTHVRISYTASLKTLARGLARLASGLQNLGSPAAH